MATNSQIFPQSTWPLVGDLSSVPGNPNVTVDGIQNIPVSSTTPLDQQGLVFQASLGKYVPTSVFSGTTVVGETPSGTVNGSNVTFTLAHTPVSGTLALYQNGARLSGGGVDYTLSVATITFVTAPHTSNILLADYSY